MANDPKAEGDLRERRLHGGKILNLSLYDLTLPEMVKWMAAQKQPAYRARQVYEALYQKGQGDPSSWTVIPKPLREQFSREFPESPFSLVQKQESSDGTAKWLWKLHDGQFLETVLIPAAESRRTVCVSSQVGCAYRCAFCASGMKGFLRDLTAGEIVQQVVQVQRALQCHPRALQCHPRESEDQIPAFAGMTKNRVGNIVFMGMGEPLSNYDNVIQAIRILNSPEGLKIGARKITLSTVGLVPMMEKLAKEGLQVELAISLHAPNDQVRGKLMPVNRRYSLVRLLVACRAYSKATKRLITFEYILIDGVNDQPEHAEELAKRLKGLFCKVNLIPCHPIPGAPWGRSPQARMLAFEKILRLKGIACTLRQSRGLDIEGACGQLRLRHETPTAVE